MLKLVLTKLQRNKIVNETKFAEQCRIIERIMFGRGYDVNDYSAYLYTLKGHTISIPPKD